MIRALGCRIGVLDAFAFDAVTLEPTTLLRWAAGATGLGRDRRRKLRKRGDHAA
jgi:hypothetical protein